MIPPSRLSSWQSSHHGSYTEINKEPLQPHTKRGMVCLQHQKWEGLKAHSQSHMSKSLGYPGPNLLQNCCKCSNLAGSHLEFALQTWLMVCTLNAPNPLFGLLAAKYLAPLEGWGGGSGLGTASCSQNRSQQTQHHTSNLFAMVASQLLLVHLLYSHRPPSLEWLVASFIAPRVRSGPC